MLDVQPNGKPLTPEVQEQWLRQALNEYPNDGTCHFCNGPNTFVDDVGFFYIVDPREPETRDEIGCLTNKIYPACKSCYDAHSWKHHKIYGLGER